MCQCDSVKGIVHSDGLGDGLSDGDGQRIITSIYSSRQLYSVVFAPSRQLFSAKKL